MRAMDQNNKITIEEMHKEEMKFNRRIGAVLLLIVLLIVGINMYSRYRDIQRSKDYKYTVSMETKVTERSTKVGRRRSYEYSVWVKYSVDGDDMTYVFWDTDFSYEFLYDGQPLRVYYKEDDPENAYIAKKDWLTKKYLRADKSYNIPLVISGILLIIAIYFFIDDTKPKKKKTKGTDTGSSEPVLVDPNEYYAENLHELARMSNYKRGWMPFWIGGSLFYAFTLFMGVMLIYSYFSKPDQDVSMVFVAVFVLLLGHGMLAGVIVSIFYLRNKKNRFIRAFMADAATEVYRDREKAAEMLWKRVKHYMEKETPWSRYKLEYDRNWLAKYSRDLEKYL